MHTWSPHQQEKKTSLTNHNKKKSITALKNLFGTLLMTWLLTANISSYAQKDTTINAIKQKTTVGKKITLPKVDHQKIIKILPEYLIQEYGQDVWLELLREHLRIEINAIRKKYQKSEVVMDEYLNQKAQDYAQYMGDNDHFSHYDKTGKPFAEWVNTDGNLYFPEWENLAYGIMDITEVINCWMNSPGHKATIIESTYNRGKVVFNKFWFWYKDGYYVLVLWGK